MTQLEIGKINVLSIVKFVEFGAYLDGGTDGEILLPKAEVPEGCEIGDTIEAVVVYDSNDRLIATTRMPKALVGEFALLKVLSVQPVGAFLDWGLLKDLFLPFAEQTRPLRAGQNVLVYVYRDKSGRIAGSMRLERNLEKGPGDLQEGEAVELIVSGKTELGYKAIINGRRLGVLYRDEVFRELQYGERLTGSIKKIRDDGKIDLSISRPGHQAASEDIGPRILEHLRANGGFMAINDKTPAETIYELFGVSKKKYKIALGALYRERLIRVEDDGIHLV